MRQFLLVVLVLSALFLAGGCAEQQATPVELKYAAAELAENPLACNVDSDCHIVFTHCGCRNTCRNIYDNAQDCTSACTDEETDVSINSCECDSYACKPKLSEVAGNMVRRIREEYESLTPAYPVSGRAVQETNSS